MATLTFATLNDPLAVYGTYATGINGNGEIVGYYVDTNGADIGFVYNGGTYTTIVGSDTFTPVNSGQISNAPASSVNIVPLGINNAGEIVGYFKTAVGGAGLNGGTDAFIYLYGSTGAFSVFELDTLSTFNFAPTTATALDNQGQIVGYGINFSISTTSNSSFDGANLSAYTGDQYKMVPAATLVFPSTPVAGVDVEGATEAEGINNQGEVVGSWVGTDPSFSSIALSHGFIYTNSVYYYFDEPNAVGGTFAQGVNDSDVIVGYYLDGNGLAHGFEYNQLTQTFTTINVPGAAQTYLYGIDDAGAMVGAYVDSSGMSHGFGVDLPASTTTSPSSVDYNFNGDGMSDILWRNATTGNDVVWTMNGSSVVSTQTLYNVPSGYSVAGMGDFNGDGTTSLLWRDSTTGSNDIWLMGNGAITASNGIDSLSSQWSVAAIADFNGDGTDDILLRNSTIGSDYIWTINSGQISGGNEIYNVPSSWTIAGVGEFFGGSQPDILLRQASTGTNYIWEMSGTNIVGGTLLDNADSTWAVAGLGDFNGNGTTDVFMRQASTGTDLLWTIQNGTVASSTVLPNAPSNWTVAAIADFTGDGTDDILMRDPTSGTDLLWTMQNGAVAHSTVLNNLSSAWSVAEVGDFNGDGTADILWSNSSTGASQLWTMNNGAITSSVALPTSPTGSSVVNNGHLTG
jgi:hypothetical protein